MSFFKVKGSVYSNLKPKFFLLASLPVPLYSLSWCTLVEL